MKSNQFGTDIGDVGQGYLAISLSDFLNFHETEKDSFEVNCSYIEFIEKDNIVLFVYPNAHLKTFNENIAWLKSVGFTDEFE